MSGAIVSLIAAIVMQSHTFASDDAQLAAVRAALPSEKEPLPMPTAPEPVPGSEPEPMLEPDPEPKPELEIEPQPTDRQPEVGTPVKEPELDKPVVDEPEIDKPVRKAKPYRRPIRRVPSPPQVEDLYETR